MKYIERQDDGTVIVWKVQCDRDELNTIRNRVIREFGKDARLVSLISRAVKGDFDAMFEIDNPIETGERNLNGRIDSLVDQVYLGRKLDKLPKLELLENSLNRVRNSQRLAMYYNLASLAIEWQIDSVITRDMPTSQIK